MKPAFSKYIIGPERHIWLVVHGLKSHLPNHIAKTYLKELGKFLRIASIIL
ncbi:hypothetical protein SOVF_004960 [Spinacia oleracea]|nr:hypothetical protein SOVF_004960 [Spinacia oleracea]